MVCFGADQSFIYGGSLGLGVFRSADDGKTWAQFNTGLQDLAIHALFADGTFVFAGTSSGIFRSNSHGDSWLPSTAGLGSLSVTSFTSFDNVVVAGTANGGIFVSSNEGENWQSANQGLPVSRVHTLITDGQDVYAGTDIGGVCRRPLAEMISTLAVGEQPKSALVGFQLLQNYANPFNPSTTIRYALPHRSHVTLTVFSTLGQKVAELVSGEIDAGYHEVQFNATNLASGVYFSRIQAGSFVESKSLVLIK